MSQEHINSLQKNVPTQEKLPEVLEPVRSANVVGNQATQKTFDELFHAPAGSLGKCGRWAFMRRTAARRSRCAAPLPSPSSRVQIPFRACTPSHPSLY